MPLMSSVDLHYAKTVRPPVRLDFAISRHSGTQASVHDRLVLKPEIDLTRYEFRAVIDWIEVIVELGRTTQFQHVQNALRSLFPRVCFVRAVAPGPGNTSTTFSFRVQEPRSAAHVFEACNTLAGKFGSAAEPLLHAIEISVDARPKPPSDEDRARMFGVMQRTIYTSQDVLGAKLSRPRYSISDGDPEFLFLAFKSDETTQDSWLLTEEDNRVPVDGTFYLGAKDDDPVLIRLMDKVLDRQYRESRTFDVLTESEQRVRIEATLRGAALIQLGVNRVADLREFSYASLQGKHFQFKVPTFLDVHSNEASALAAVRRAVEGKRLRRFLSTGITGLMVRRHAEDRFRSRHLPELKRQLKRDGSKMCRDRRGAGATWTLVAYEELNRVVSRALWGLTKRERTAWKQMETR